MTGASQAFALALLASTQGGTVPGPPPSPALAPPPELCGLVLRCGLQAALPGCAADARVPGVRYDDERCAEARELHARGLDPGDPRGRRVYRFLGLRYRVVFRVRGTAGLSPERLAFLLDELPLAARLLTFFRKTPYAAEYLDAERRRFRGRRGKDLAGEAELVAGAAREGAVYYFGTGSSKLAFWRLRGQGLLRAEFERAGPGGGLGYRLTVVAAPANAFVNALMKLGLFKGAVEGHLRSVLADITAAATRLEKEGIEAVVEDPSFAAEERARLQALLQLPAR